LLSLVVVYAAVAVVIIALAAILFHVVISIVFILFVFSAAITTAFIVTSTWLFCFLVRLYFTVTLIRIFLVVSASPLVKSLPTSPALPGSITTAFIVTSTWLFCFLVRLYFTDTLIRVFLVFSASPLVQVIANIAHVTRILNGFGSIIVISIRLYIECVRQFEIC
jgi:hypothetical protein